jgi:hypothetical protein
MSNQSVTTCTGHCFTTDYYIDLIKNKIALHDISDVDAMEDEIRKLAKETRMGYHCNRCYERSTQCIWYAYTLLIS